MADTPEKKPRKKATKKPPAPATPAELIALLEQYGATEESYDEPGRVTITIGTGIPCPFLIGETPEEQALVAELYERRQAYKVRLRGSDPLPPELKESLKYSDVIGEGPGSQDAYHAWYAHFSLLHNEEKTTFALEILEPDDPWNPEDPAWSYGTSEDEDGNEIEGYWHWEHDFYTEKELEDWDPIEKGYREYPILLENVHPDEDIDWVCRYLLKTLADSGGKFVDNWNNQGDHDLKPGKFDEVI